MATGRPSAADLVKGLKGADFPMNKKELIEHARENGAAEKVVEVIREMPARQYQSVAEVAQALGQVQ